MQSLHCICINNDRYIVNDGYVNQNDFLSLLIYNIFGPTSCIYFHILAIDMSR
jgi:hypothetical protein